MSSGKLGRAWKILTISFGAGLILAGLAGLFLPILQGWLMILAGLAVLSPHSRKARTILNTLKRKLGIKSRKTGKAPEARTERVESE